MTARRAEAFALHDVPARPVIRVDFLADDAGDEWALVDGDPVAPVPGLTAREAALAHVAALVDARAGRDALGRPAPAVRVAASAPSGAILHLVVHRDGRVFVDPPPPAHPPPPGAADDPWPDVDATAWSAPTVEADAGPRWAAALPPDPGPAVADVGDAWPDVPPGIGQATRPPPPGPPPGTDPPDPGNPGDAGAEAAGDAPPPGLRRPDPATTVGRPARTAEPTLLKPRRRVVLSRRWAALGLAGVLALVTLGGWGVHVLRAGPDVGIAHGAEATFPGSPPDGWSAQGRWVTPPLAPDSGPVVPLGDTVAFVTHARALVVADAATGAVQWSQRLPDGPLVGGLHRTSIAGADVLALQTGTRLSWWPVGGGRGQEVELPPNARTSYYGAGPLVGVDAKTAAVIADGRLTHVVVPGGAYALAARADGTVTAASAQGWWHLTPGQAAPMVTAWEDPDPNHVARGAAPRLVGYTGGTLLTVSPPDLAGNSFVVAYTDRPRSVLLAFRGRLAGDAATATWHPAPSGTWGILGRTLVDLDAGRVTDLGGGWQTRLVAEDRAIGLIDDAPVIAGPTIPRAVLTTGSAFPEGVTTQGALVRAEVDGGQVVYLLPPA